MEIVIGVVVLLVIASVAFVATKSRSKGRVELEPPPAPLKPGGPTATPTKPEPTATLTPTPIPVPTPDADVAVPDELVEQVEEALAQVEPEPQLEPEPEPELEPEKPARFRDRLSRARSQMAGYVGSVLGRSEITNETWDELEEALVRADVGINTTSALLDDLRARVKNEGIKTPQELLDALKTDLKKALVAGDRTLRFEPGSPNVWLFVGVNGVGKTTTIGKIGLQQVTNGRSVVMAAGDTFRAAAAEQLTMWAERVGADIVRGAEGGDPGAIIFDAVQRAASKNTELVLADTAGRLHTKVNLMEELKKVRRVADRDPGTVTETLLVLDATTGQNGMTQAKLFAEAVDVTGVVLTKLDGTAKGGIAFAIQTELGIPIKLVGLGEGAADLIPFDPDEFVEALFSAD